ncbi:hypothetical protein [Actinomadura sp. 3N407]|uniref:hypothetical protein n=1 Tax=Actinomadura sp. 3N407 TaxID=3457423 RepID=UPI003FCDEF26
MNVTQPSTDRGAQEIMRRLRGDGAGAAARRRNEQARRDHEQSIRERARVIYAERLTAAGPVDGPERSRILAQAQQQAHQEAEQEIRARNEQAAGEQIRERMEEIQRRDSAPARHAQWSERAAAPLRDLQRGMPYPEAQYHRHRDRGAERAMAGFYGPVPGVDGPDQEEE